MAPSSPTVARWELSLRIRARRHEKRLDVKTITDQLGFSRNYWSAVENDRTLLAKDKLEALFDILDFDETDRKELRQLRRESREHGWWMDYPVLETGELREMQHFYGLEAGAEHIRTFEGALITGLLQTEEYARAIMAADPAISTLQLDQLVEIRMTRQRLLRAERPLRITTLMSEAAIRQEVGGRDVLARQLAHVLQLMDELRDTVDVHVLPFTTSPGGIIGASTLHILDFASEELDRVVWRESIVPIGVVENTTMRHWIELSFEQAMGRSLSREESAIMIERRSTELAAQSA